MDVSILSVTTGDLQQRARETLGRELTDEELRVATNCFLDGIEWVEIADIAAAWAAGE